MLVLNTVQLLISLNQSSVLFYYFQLLFIQPSSCGDYCRLGWVLHGSFREDVLRIAGARLFTGWMDAVMLLNHEPAVSVH